MRGRMCLTIWLSLVGVWCAAAAEPMTEPGRVSRLVLRSSAAVSGDVIQFSDVLSLAGADESLQELLAEETLLRGIEGPSVEVTHAQVVQRLEGLDVNLARVLVSGALRCHVSVQPSGATVQTEPSVALSGHASPIEPANPPRKARSGDGTQSLAEAIEQIVRGTLADSGGEVQIDFERAGAEFLRLTNPPFEFHIKPRGGQRLGLREFSVAINRDGQRQRSVVLVANVRLLRPVIVAAKPLNAGSCVKREALDFATHLFSDDAELGYSSPDELIGQVVQKFIPAGQMLRRGDLKQTDLVLRSRPVTVVGGNNVYVRLSGTALDSGGFGETVRVRLGDTRNSKRVVRGVVTGLAAVRLTEE